MPWLRVLGGADSLDVGHIANVDDVLEEKSIDSGMKYKTKFSSKYELPAAGGGGGGDSGSSSSGGSGTKRKRGQ